MTTKERVGATFYSILKVSGSDSVKSASEGRLDCNNGEHGDVGALRWAMLHCRRTAGDEVGWNNNLGKKEI